MTESRRRHMLRLLAGVLALLAVTVVAPPAAHATDTAVPAYGSITISDVGTGPRATWTYDGVLDCVSSWTGPTGVPQSVKVECFLGQTVPAALGCPEMIVMRTTATVVGARATCSRTLDLGVGTTAATSADLGDVEYEIACEAYVDYGVLVPPYTVTCDEPGLPR
ncbi:MAG: hypothetical protein QOG34_1575 [Frankiaceae bacterium]|nr:hypothetical protein [Frankiaceae bacterium]